MDIHHFFQRYSEIFEQGDQDAVVAFLQQSIAEAHDDPEALVTILNETAGYYRCISRFAESVDAAERVLALLRQLGQEDTVAHGTSLLNAATAYRGAGDSIKALQLFIMALDIFKARLAEDDYRLAGLYNNIAEIHKEAENLDAALELLEQACTIMSAKPDMEEDYAIVLANRGAVLLGLQRTDEAMDVLDKAKTLFDRHAEHAGALAPHYAALLASTGELHFRNGCFKKAAETYEDVLSYIQKYFGENAHYAITCQNCADAYEAAGNYAKARIMSEKSQNIMEKLQMDVA